ncbi:hypothetical protein SPV_2502 [Streptococcus pneumoniae]|nr:hypothetical protein SPV_2502 [Streptococcus pneumoniae]
MGVSQKMTHRIQF